MSSEEQPYQPTQPSTVDQTLNSIHPNLDFTREGYIEERSNIKSNGESDHHRNNLFINNNIYSQERYSDQERLPNQGLTQVQRDIFETKAEEALSNEDYDKSIRTYTSLYPNPTVSDNELGGIEASSPTFRKEFNVEGLQPVGSVEDNKRQIIDYASSPNQQQSNNIEYHPQISTFTSPQSNRFSLQNGQPSVGFNSILDKTRQLLSEIKGDSTTLKSTTQMKRGSETREQISSPGPLNPPRSSALSSSQYTPGPRSIAYTSLDQKQTERIQRALSRIKDQQPHNLSKSHILGSPMRPTLDPYLSTSFQQHPENTNIETSYLGIHHTQDRQALKNDHQDLGKPYDPTISQPRSLYEANKEKIQNLIESIRRRNEQSSNETLGTPYYERAGTTGNQFQFGPNYYLPNYYPSYVGAVSYYTRGLELTKKIIHERQTYSIDMRNSEGKDYLGGEKELTEHQKKENVEVNESINGHHLKKSKQLETPQVDAQRNSTNIEIDAKNESFQAKQRQKKEAPKKASFSEKDNQELQEQQNSSHRGTARAILLESSQSPERNKSDDKEDRNSGLRSTYKYSENESSHGKEHSGLVYEEINHPTKGFSPEKDLEMHDSEDDNDNPVNDGKLIVSRSISPDVDQTEHHKEQTSKVSNLNTKNHEIDLSNLKSQGNKNYHQEVPTSKHQKSLTSAEQGSDREENSVDNDENLPTKDFYNPLNDRNVEAYINNEDQKDETEIFAELEKSLQPSNKSDEKTSSNHKKETSKDNTTIHGEVSSKNTHVPSKNSNVTLVDYAQGVQTKPSQPQIFDISVVVTKDVSNQAKPQIPKSITISTGPQISVVSQKPTAKESSDKKIRQQQISTTATGGNTQLDSLKIQTHIPDKSSQQKTTQSQGLKLISADPKIIKTTKTNSDSQANQNLRNSGSSTGKSSRITDSTELQNPDLVNFNVRGTADFGKPYGNTPQKSSSRDAFAVNTSSKLNSSTSKLKAENSTKPSTSSTQNQPVSSLQYQQQQSSPKVMLIDPAISSAKKTIKGGRSQAVASSQDGKNQFWKGVYQNLDSATIKKK